MHVLLIEPDIVLAAIYTDTFKRAGYRVTHVRGAQAAVCIADSRRPDVVVLEMQLAAHSGAAFLYEFRSYQDWSSVPIIMHTLVHPDTVRVYEKSLKELGVVAALYKPQTSLGELLATVRSYGNQVLTT